MPEPNASPDPLRSPNTLRVLVVDDEALARQRILRLLEREPDVEVVGSAASGGEAVEAIRRLGPHMVFLDVQMPGMTGLDVVREVVAADGPEAMPVTVFVTAYDQHAVAAFELAALDYLLKPYENERFRQALGRARSAVRTREVEALQDRMVALLQHRSAAPGGAATPEPQDQAPQYLERIAVEMRGQVRVLPVERIDHFAAEGNYVRIHAGDEAPLINDTMGSLEERLDPKHFFRIHRSSIVQLDRVEALLTAPGGDYAVRLCDGKRLKVARNRRDALAERLGLNR